MTLRRKILVSVGSLVVVLTVAAAAGFFVFTSECSASGLDAFTGDPRPVTSESLAPAMLGGEYYSDKYTIEAYLTDGGKLYISGFVRNFGMGDGKLTLKSRVNLPDGSEMKGGGNELARDDWSFEKSPFKLAADGQSITGTPRKLEVRGTGQGYTFEATFTPIVPAWRPGSGRITFGKPDVMWDTTLVQPKASVKGWVEINGERKEVKGYGYVLHTYANIPPYEHAKRWVDFRSISGSTVVYYKEFTAPEKLGGATVPYLLIAHKGKVVFESLSPKTDYGDFLTDNKHQNQYRVPRKVLITAESGGTTVKLAIAATRLGNREDIIAGLSSLEAAIVSKVAQPVNYLFDGKFEALITTPEGEIKGSGKGTLEVNHVNK